MELTCPECGRAYDIPDHTTQRLFKCICKFTFAVDNARAGKSTKKGAENFTAKSEVSSFNEDSKGSISEAAITQFASNLRKNIPTDTDSPSEREVLNSKPPPNFSAVIEVDEQRVVKKNGEREAKLKSISHEEDESTLEVPGRKSKLNEIRQRQLKIEKTIWTAELCRKLVEDRKWQAGILAASAGVITISLFSYDLLTRIPPPPPDPFLNQLLTKQETSPVVESSSKAEVKDDQPENPPAFTPVVKTIPNQNVKSKAKTNYLRMISDGRFQGVEKFFEYQKNLGGNDRALLLELALLGRDENLRTKVSFILEDENGVRKNPAMQRTAALYLIGDLKTRGTGINQLLSLQLTRPRDALVSAYLGLAYKDAKRPDLAFQAWGQAITQDQSLAWLQKEREELARANGRLDLAKEAALGLSKIAGHESDGYFRLGRIAKLLGEDNASIKYLEQSVKKKDQVTTRLYLAEALAQKKEWNKADANLEKALKLSPTTLENRNLFFIKGKIFCGQKKLKEARSIFDRAISLDGNYFKALEAKADCELSLNEEAKAAKTLEKLLKKSPQNHLVWLKYGRALRLAEKSNPKAALAAIQRSLDIQATDRAHLEMAYALRALNRGAEAKRHLRDAIELNPSNLEAQRLARELQ